MEIATKSIDEQLQIQDQSVVYQLRRSCHKIEQLKEEIDRLRRDKDSQLLLLTTLQHQLKESKREVAMLQSRNIDLIGELDILTRKLGIIQSNDETLVLSQQLLALKSRYINCQEENDILRSELKCKDQELQVYIDKLLLLANSNKKQELSMQDLLDKMGQHEAKIANLQTANAQLQQVNIQHKANQKEMEGVIEDYKQLLMSLHLQVGQAQRGQEGWFCEFSDLKDTVEHIEQARANYRHKRLVNNL